LGENGCVTSTVKLDEHGKEGEGRKSEGNHYPRAISSWDAGFTGGGDNNWGPFGSGFDREVV